jgi:putative tricarboxylic transport membrane protein
MDLELLIAAATGTTAGILIGLLPGLGTTSLLLVCFPFLVKQSLIFCIVFYCVASSISQYFGSVTTLTFGIPGENTSLPLFSIRDKILESNRLNEIYYLCAFGSLIASLLSLVVLYFSIDFFLSNVFYLKSYFSLFFAIVGLFLCVLYSNNRIITSIILLLTGWFFGKVGYNEILNSNFMTFDNSYLYSGIPSLPAIMGIYALPSLYFMTKRLKELKEIRNNSLVEFNMVNSTFENLTTVFRSSLVGFVSGLIPYIGNSISSNMAFNMEKKLKPNNYVAQATASESANNSANISVLVPLLFLGVAIVPSEFVLLEIIASSNSFINWKTIYSNFITILLILLVTNAFAFYISWICLKGFNKFIARTASYLPILIFGLVTSSIFYLGFNLNQGTFYLVVLFFFFSLGLLLSKLDLLPFTYAFLLQNNVEQLFYRFYQIYIL